MSKMTRQGYEKLKEELEHLEKVEKPNISKILKEAISEGDLSENFAYQDGKDRQAKAETRIAFLKDELKHAEIEDTPSLNVVTVGNTIILEKEDKTKATFVITGNEEADPLKNKISYDSPIGKAVMEKEAGVVVQVETPAGTKKYKIVSIA